MEVVWSEESLRDYFKIIDYLISEWNSKIAVEFDFKLNQLVENIQTFNQICPKSSLLNYHKCKIDNHNSLIYEILSDKLFIVAIIDSRSNHSY